MPQGKEYCSIKRMQFAALCANYIISFVSQNNKKKIIPLKLSPGRDDPINFINITQIGAPKKKREMKARTSYK